jgi:Chondroitinase B
VHTRSLCVLFLMAACAAPSAKIDTPGGEGGGDQQAGSGGSPMTATGGKPATGGTSGAGGGTPDAGPMADARSTPRDAAGDTGTPSDPGPTPDASPPISEPASCARKVPASDLTQLAAAIAAAMPGDCVVLANGSYNGTGVISINRTGTPEAPIVITAETIGGATIAGMGGFSLDMPAAHVIIRGFKFTHAGGLVMGLGTHHCLITRNVFQPGGGNYLYIQGLDQEVSYNIFQNKTSEGGMVRLDAPSRSHAGTQRTYIHHNHFLKHEFAGGNGGECIATWGGFTRAEHNLFEQCNGDPEIISIKASDGIYRYNTFRGSSRGMVTLRYSNRTIIDGNYFFGLRGGIRAYGKDHKIINNHFEGNNGVGIFVSHGSGTNYIQIERMLIAHNTLVNDGIAPRGGEDPPLTVTIANNIIRKDGGTFINAGGDWQATYAGNIFWGSATTNIPAAGFRKVDPLLMGGRLGAGSPAIDSASGAHGVMDDIDGQPRTGLADVGADEVSTAPVLRRPLTARDVGPMAGM